MDKKKVRFTFHLIILLTMSFYVMSLKCVVLINSADLWNMVQIAYGVKIQWHWSVSTNLHWCSYATMPPSKVRQSVSLSSGLA